MIRNTKTISEALNERYTVEKVRFANEFLKTHPQSRNIKYEDWLEAYNYIRNANDVINPKTCKPCTFSKYVISIKNYAQYGKQILLQRGIDIDKPIEETPVEEEIIEETPIDKPIEEPETIEETIEEPIEEETPKKKVKKK